MKSMNLRNVYIIYILYFRVGTTKTTNHIPGYNGFLPKTDMNPLAVA